MDADATQPESKSLTAAGIELAYAEWRPELRDQGPTLLFAHATGFHGRIWDEIISLLPPAHVIAVDSHGHGRSSGAPLEGWRQVAEEYIALVDQLQINQAIGIGHSMGGYALTKTAGARADAFARLVLIDPVIAEPEAYTGQPGIRVDMVAKRKSHFASPEEMIDRFKDRIPYKLFTPRTLENYCVHGLRKRGDGEGYDLACPPEVEASVYGTSRSDTELYSDIAKVRCPVTIVRVPMLEMTAGNINFLSSPTWEGLAAQFADAEDRFYPDFTHFLPMQDPHEAARFIHEAIRAETG